MNALVMELLPYVRQGMCCSQLLMLLATQARGEENPGLVRSMGGLCHGIGQSGGPCGLLSGGAAALAWLSGTDGGEAHPMLEPMVNEYATWFYERCQSYGGYGCEQVVNGLASATGAMGGAGTNAADGKPDMSLCADLLAECWEKILELYDSYDLGSVGA